MNSSVYVFGNLGNGYTQYPDDYAKEIYQHFYANSSAPSQITIHRDNNLIYYGYIRKLDVDSQYIGFCVLLNGVMFSHIERLFPVFENAIADMAAKGSVLHFNDRGDLTSSTVNLYEAQNEVERIIQILQIQISGLESNIQKMPPVSYGVSCSESKTFSDGDKSEDIVSAACRYGYTYILKDKDFDSVSLTSYKGVIVRLNKEKESVEKELYELKSKYQKLTAQKRQYKKVIFLCILIVVCGIALFFLKDLLDATQSNLAEAQNNLSQKENIINNRNETIAGLRASLFSEQSSREKIEIELSELKSSFSEIMPIIITDIEIANVYSDGSIETDYGGVILSNYSMYVKPKIAYKGIKVNENISLDIKLYTPNGLSRSPSSPSYCSWTESLDILRGDNTYSFQGWGGDTKGHWTSGTYRFEFWYGNVCLNSKTFYIH